MYLSKSWSLLLVFLLLCQVSFAEPPKAKKKGELAGYVRHTKSPGKLETSIVTYRNAKGQTVDLISAVHIGSSSYYQTLNKRFKSYDAVLYELILPDDMAGQRLPQQMESGSGVSGMQGMMARSLGLTTQIEKIDYSAANFVHADLTQGGLNQAMASRQENLMGYLLKAMSSGGMEDADLGITDEEMAQLDLMALLNGQAKPKDRKILRKLFAATLASSGGVLSSLGDTALIKTRNEAALKVLNKETKAGKRRLALFYGAAHMPDISKRLKKSGWKRTKTKWVTAWSI